MWPHFSTVLTIQPAPVRYDGAGAPGAGCLAAGTVVGTPIRSSFSGAAACSAVPACRVTAWLSRLRTTVVQCPHSVVHGQTATYSRHIHFIGKLAARYRASLCAEEGASRVGKRSNGSEQRTVVLRARAGCLPAPSDGVSKLTSHHAWKEQLTCRCSRRCHERTSDRCSAPALAMLTLRAASFLASSGRSAARSRQCHRASPGNALVIIC